MSSQARFGEIAYPNLVGLSFSAVVAYVICIAVYRLYFHPLARFPGPFWCRLSKIPSWWKTRTGDRHIWLYSLQEKYGPEFRYRPDGVLLNTPKAFRKIFGATGNVKKGDYYQVWPRNVNQVNTWNTTSLPIHARKRRVLNYAFSEAALRSTETFLHANIDRWLELMGQISEKPDEWSTSFDMSAWMNYLVSDILSDLCFGKSFDMKEPDSKLRHVPEMMASFLEIMHVTASSPWSKFFVWMKPRGLDKLMEKAAPAPVKLWGAFVDDCLEKRTKMENELNANPKPESETRKDFFYWLFKAVDPVTGERGYTLDELWGECELLTIAGSDTTSIVLSGAFFYLVRNPEVQKRLAGEILSTFSSIDEIRSGNKLLSCKYLTAFLHEAMRITPPVPSELDREVLPGGTTVDGHFLPEGVHVSTGLFCLSFNKDVYPEPFKFRPERWIVSENPKEGSSPEEVARAESGFCTFSAGSRGCVGKNLAWLEMRILVAKALWHFEFGRDPTNNLGGGDKNAKPERQNEDLYQTWDFFVSIRKGPMVQVRRRAH